MKKGRLFLVGVSLLAARFFGSRKPLFISWQITNRCNSRCKYCDYWKFPGKKELSTREICGIINDLAKLGTCAISFTGGEPLLRNDIGDISKYAKMKGIACKINTNGILVAKKIGELANIDQVNLSFDGPEHIHDQVRGAGSYAGLFDAVSVLNKNKKRVIFHVVISRYNSSAIDDILEKCRQVNVGAFFQPATELYLLKKGDNPHASDRENFRSAVRLLIEKKKKGERHILNSISGLNHLAHWPESRRIFCSAGKIIFRVNPAGEIYNCERFPASNVFNCLDDGLNKALRKKGFAGCSQCWCGPLVELNLLMQGKINAIINSLSYI